MMFGRAVHRNVWFDTLDHAVQFASEIKGNYVPDSLTISKGGDGQWIVGFYCGQTQWSKISKKFMIKFWH